MTHAEEIMRAVAVLVKQHGKNIFSRREIRDQIGLTQDEWMSGYTAIFQGMRSELVKILFAPCRQLYTTDFAQNTMRA